MTIHKKITVEELDEAQVERLLSNDDRVSYRELSALRREAIKAVLSMKDRGDGAEFESKGAPIRAYGEGVRVIAASLNTPSMEDIGSELYPDAMYAALRLFAVQSIARENAMKQNQMQNKDVQEALDAMTKAAKQLELCALALSSIFNAIDHAQQSLDAQKEAKENKGSVH